MEQKTPYLALARRYRPRKFSDLIGQDAAVRILQNAIRTKRIHHAYLFCGVRGIGKTTLARLLAAALNCQNRNPETHDPCSTCESCVAILNNQHIDVIEFDAASHTSVENIRDLIDATAYRASMAAYKIYVIDEVHMLSEKAFNALLKTLEEPSEGVVFIFATTEARSIPKTIISRCLRFDLRLVDNETLHSFINVIATKEGFQLDHTALTTIVTGAEGSVRDGLSLLDQALNLASNQKVSGEMVRSMLGIGERSHLYQLIDNLLEARIKDALEHARQLIEQGSDPLILVRDMMDILHEMIETKLQRQGHSQASAAENSTHDTLIQSLSTDVGIRVWQVLHHGYQELLDSPLPQQSLDLLLIRLAHASQVPSIEPYLKHLAQQNPAPRAKAFEATTAKIEPSPKAELKTFQDLLKMLRENKDPFLADRLERTLHIIAYQPGSIRASTHRQVSSSHIREIEKELKLRTNREWLLSIEGTEEKPQSPFEKKIAEKKQSMAPFRQEAKVQQIEETSPFRLTSVEKEE